MVRLNVATTIALNPVGTSPAITIAEAWRILVYKCSNPTKFIPAIVACDVVSQDDNVVVRRVTFAEGAGPPTGSSTTTEKITFLKHVKVESHLIEPDSFVSNVLSTGTEDGELYFTMVFNMNHPEIAENSPEEEARRAAYTLQGRQAVEATRQKMREMVTEL